MNSPNPQHMDEATSLRDARVSFGRFVFDGDERVLSCEGAAVALPPKVIETLAILIAHAGHVVEKTMLRDCLWPEGFVEDGNLTQNIYILRRTLDPHGNGRAFIETVPRRGYRFCASLAPPAAPALHVPAPALAAMPVRSFALARSTRALAAALLAIALLAIGGASAGSQVAHLPPAAARAYALGRFYWNQRTDAGFARAETYFRETIRIAPESALGYDGIADIHLIRAQHDDKKVSRAELVLAKRYRDIALGHDAKNGETHTTSAFISYFFGHDNTAARREFAAALDANPNHPTAHQWYGVMLLSEGNVAAATRELEIANALDPTAEVVTRWLGIAYYFGRRHDDATRLFRQSLDLVPGDVDSLFKLAYIQEQRGHYPEALAMVDRIAREHPHKVSYLEVLRTHVELAAHRKPTASTLVRLRHRAAARDIDLADYALVLDRLGRRDEAFAWLKKATRMAPAEVAWLRLDPRLDPFRTDPRFARLFQTS